MELDLRDYLRVLRKRRWIVAGALVVCTGFAFIATSLSSPVYEARAKLFVGQRQFAASDIQTGFQLAQLSQQLLKSYATVIRTRPIAERAVERENLGIPPTAVAGGLQANPILGTQIIELSFQSTSPALAQRAVNAVAEAFVEEIERLEAPRPGATDPAVKVSVVEPALLPGSPVRPRPRRNLALGLMLGGLLGVGLALLLESLDTSIRTPEQVEQITGVPILAAIPRVQTEGRGIYLERDTQSIGAEAFRKLRTAVQFLGVDHPVQMVMVTSPMPQDGKTTTSLNLAASFAQAGLKTIIVEADLRRPTLHHVFKVDGQRGLTTALIGRIPLDQAILPTHHRNLHVIPAGAIPPTPGELLASDHMADLLNQLRTRADLVVIDTPPVLPVADASSLAIRVDGTILVAKAGTTHRERLAEATSLLNKVGGRLLGVVLNFIGPDDGKYGYYYYYSGYEYKSEPVAFESGSTHVSPTPLS